jgi:hypothetical protein
MDPLIGTPQCQHLGYDIHGGLPCCHADDATRTACGCFAPNPSARNAAQFSAVEPYYCTVLGTDSLPPEALRLAAQEKARARRAEAPPRPGYQAPDAVRGVLPARPQKEADADGEPVIPTHTIRNDGTRTAPNAPCPCGSGKKFKKCCYGKM